MNTFKKILLVSGLATSSFMGLHAGETGSFYRRFSCGDEVVIFHGTAAPETHFQPLFNLKPNTRVTLAEVSLVVCDIVEREFNFSGVKLNSSRRKILFNGDVTKLNDFHKSLFPRSSWGSLCISFEIDDLGNCFDSITYELLQRPDSNFYETVVIDSLKP